MGNNSFGICRGCGKQVIWIRTKAGRNMPVDPAIINFKKASGGKDRIVLETGEVVSGERCNDAGHADGHGYISHFATCPNAGRYRRK